MYELVYDAVCVCVCAVDALVSTRTHCCTRMGAERSVIYAIHVASTHTQSGPIGNTESGFYELRIIECFYKRHFDFFFFSRQTVFLFIDIYTKMFQKSEWTNNHCRVNWAEYEMSCPNVCVHNGCVYSGKCSNLAMCCIKAKTFLEHEFKKF